MWTWQSFGITHLKFITHTVFPARLSREAASVWPAREWCGDPSPCGEGGPELGLPMGASGQSCECRGGDGARIRHSFIIHSISIY